MTGDTASNGIRQRVWNRLKAGVVWVVKLYAVLLLGGLIIQVLEALEPVFPSLQLLLYSLQAIVAFASLGKVATMIPDWVENRVQSVFSNWPGASRVRGQATRLYLLGKIFK